MKIRSWVRNWLGNRLGFAKCDKCKNSFWGRNDRTYILYTKSSITKYCSICGIPPGKGRLYKTDFGEIMPANNEAFRFEIKRAGQPGALYKKAKAIEK